MPTVADILHIAPHKPGVYLMKDRRGSVFYIGKAKDLHNRMHQYIHPGNDTRPFVLILDRILADVEFILTASEKEALLLENTLIKRHRPHFNVRIKDDKNYFSLKLDIRKDFPRLELVRRRPKNDKALYFGPYSSASLGRRMWRLINKHFMLRDCSDATFKNAQRPCLRHQMGRCHGPCSLPVTRDRYHEEIRHVRLLLEGRAEELIPELTAMMQAAAKEMEYERAARIRDQIAAVESSLEQQSVDLSRSVDWDVIGWKREGETAAFALLKLRNGRLVGRQALSVECRALPDPLTVAQFIQQHYQTAAPPARLLVPILPADPEPLTQWLSERAGRRVTLAVPERGDGRRLMGIAVENAEHDFSERASRAADRRRALERLERSLRLSQRPERIECVDISTFQGSQSVGSLVCFLDGEPAPGEYRRYRLKEAEHGKPDDFAMMFELLSRRFRRGLYEGTLPDLLLVDGGKGQLNIALGVLKELGIEGVDVAGLAKSRLKDEVGAGEVAESFEGKLRTPERIFRPGQKNPLLFKPGTAELNLLQHLRDEAHRFAITYHRKLRSQRNLRSGLLDIPGVGPTRAKKLLAHFGSLKRLRDTPPEAICTLPGFTPELADRILEHLKRR